MLRLENGWTLGIRLHELFRSHFSDRLLTGQAWSFIVAILD